MAKKKSITEKVIDKAKDALHIPHDEEPAAEGEEEQDEENGEVWEDSDESGAVADEPVKKPEEPVKKPKAGAPSAKKSPEDVLGKERKNL